MAAYTKIRKTSGKNLQGVKIQGIFQGFKTKLHANLDLKGIHSILVGLESRK